MILKRSLGITALLVLLTLFVGHNSSADELPMIAYEQEQNSWCWAAVSESVLNYHGVLASQCGMANYVFGQTNCCYYVVWPDSTGPLCNKANILVDWLDLLPTFNSTKEVLKVFGNVDSSFRPWPVSKSTLEEQIKAKRPWIMGWRLTSGGGHALLGYGLSGNLVSYIDPWPFSDRLNVDDYAWVKEASDHVWKQTLLITTKGITFVIDDTGSMLDNIDAAKAAAIKVVDENTAAGKHFLYTLITFKDGDGVVRGQTLDPAEIKSLINGLSADAGAGCPESSLTAVRQAANLVPGSEIYLMTDADSNSYGEDNTFATPGEVVYTANVLAKHRVKLNSINYGRCWGPLSPADSDSLQQPNTIREPRRTKAAIDSGAGGYEYLSTVSGGLFFDIPVEDTDAATEMILKHASMDATIALYDGNAPATYDIPVDDSISSLRIVLNSATDSSNSLEVKNPSGAIVDATTDGVSVLSLGSNTTYLIQPPALATGNWNAAVTGAGSYRLSGTATTMNSLDYVGDTSLGVGGTLNMAAGLVKPVSNVTFGLITTDGTGMLPVSLYDDGTHGDAYVNDLFYVGSSVMNTVGSYRFMVAGDGYFQRMNPQVIAVGTVDVIAPTPQNTAPGVTVTQTFQIKNLGTTQDTYNLFASSSSGWADLSGLPSSITLAAGAMQDIVIPVNVPADAPPGQIDELSVQAISQTNWLINDADKTETVADNSPDLVVISLTAPTTARVGKTIKISASVTNQGSINAGASRLGVYFSTDPTITTADTLTAICNLPSLAVGTTITCSGKIIVPSSLTPEVYYLGAIADDLGAVAEGDETNNARSADTGPITLTTRRRR